MCSKMNDANERRDKVTSSNRRNNKPLMEKRRRQRINDCLVQLKSLVLQAMNKDTTQYSKLEKADILEMTVKHLKLVQRQHVTGSIASDPNAISKYRAGFNDCASEIARYLDAVNGGNPELKSRVMGYLSNSMLQFPVIPVYHGVVPSYHVQMTSPVTSQHGFPTSTYSQLNSNNGSNPVFPAHHHTSHQHAVSARETFQHRPHSHSSVKIEHLHDDDFTRLRHNSHLTSPTRRVPSPCDSDSGLSDSSASFSHDENGNYSQFNINSQQGRAVDLSSNSNRHNLQPDHQQHSLPNDQPQRGREASEHRSSPKRTLDIPYEHCPAAKRVKVVDDNRPSVKLEPPRDFHPDQEDDPMWRPW